MTPAATIIISTKNRRDELRKAVASALSQDAAVEVLVIDDGSTDGTSEMIRAEFPAARLERAEVSRGYIAQRNRAAELAAAPVVISIDDDAVFASPATVSATLKEFSSDRIGAVAMPYIDVPIGPEVRQAAPAGDGVYIAAEYRGTAHALRRDVFLRLGGYREALRHQTEEGDYCIRMLAAGFVVRAGRADPIHHFESPKRDLTRQTYFNARNNMLFAWHNVPWPWLPAHLCWTALNLARYGVRKRYVWTTVRGLSAAAADAARGRVRRQPVPLAVYRLHRWLRAHAPVELSAVEARLPARG